MIDAEFKVMVTGMLRDLTNAHIQLCGEAFANTALLSRLLLALKADGRIPADDLQKVFDDAAEEATHATMIFGTSNSTHAIKVIDSIRDAVFK